MTPYYVSLVDELLGCYVLFYANSERIVRRYVAERYGRLWCSVYRAEEFEHISKMYPNIFVPNLMNPTYLEDYDER